MGIAEKLVAVVEQFDKKLIRLTEKEFDLTSEERDRIRTNGIASFGISVLAILNATGLETDSLRMEMDRFVKTFPALAKGIRAKAPDHCSSREEAAEFFTLLAMNGARIDPADTGHVLIDGPTIVSGLYNCRVDREVEELLSREKGDAPGGIAGGIRVLIVKTCFHKDTMPSYMQIKTLSTELIKATFEVIDPELIKAAREAIDRGQNTAVKSTGTGCLFASVVLLTGFLLAGYSVVSWAMDH